MKPTSIGLGVALLLSVGFAVAQTSKAPDLGAVMKALNAREGASRGVTYAKFEITREAPAYFFDIQDADFGQMYRYRSIEEWWSDGEKCAVAISREMENYLDDALLAQTPASTEPLFAYVTDGTSTTYIDFTVPGRKLVLNCEWPFHGAAVPILFGRAFSKRNYRQVFAEQSAATRKEIHFGRPCTVVEWTKGRTRVRSWLDEKLEYLCVREVAFVNDVLVADRVYDFAQAQSGYRYPASAVERYITNDGVELIKSWRLLEFKESPDLPFFVFHPTANDAAWVIDDASGAVVKRTESIE